MSIPLVQTNDKDAINTSIIAIKRNIERINMLLGLSNSEEIDTSKFATKDELQQAVTDLQPVNEVAVDNMNSVTSNAVAKCLNYSTTEVNTGIKWTDGKDIYKKTYIYRNKTLTGGSAVVIGTKSGFSNNNVIDIEHNIRFTLYGNNTIVVRGDFEVYLLGDNININMGWTTTSVNADINLTFYYTKSV